MDWSSVLSVVVTGIVVVFLALIILITIVWLFGKVFQSMDKSKKNQTSTSTATKPTVPVKQNLVQAVPAQASSDTMTEDVVAAITAAISCILSSEGNSQPFVVKSIKRIHASRNAWNMAGMAENTRVF